MTANKNGCVQSTKMYCSHCGQNHNSSIAKVVENAAIVLCIAATALGCMLSLDVPISVLLLELTGVLALLVGSIALIKLSNNLRS